MAKPGKRKGGIPCHPLKPPTTLENKGLLGFIQHAIKQEDFIQRGKIHGKDRL